MSPPSRHLGDLLPERHDQRSSLLETAVEQANDAVVVTEASLEKPGPRILYVNPAFTGISGYTAEEAVGRTPRILQGPDTESWILDRLRHKLEHGRPFEGEAVNYRKDGRPYVNHWSISPIRDEDGTITHWVSIQRDVTDERRTSERLLRAQERERHRMARWIHDELGGLLTSLQMSLNQVKMQLEDKARAESLFSTVEARIESISTVVRSLTGLASPPVLEDHGLSDALSQLIDTLEASHDLSITLHSELEPDDRLSPLLERVVYRVLREALLNVGRHADTDAAQVLLNKTSQTLRLHVVDQGRGFDPPQPLTEGDNVGLAGMKARVERLNGTFQIRAAPGEGTRITITLPLSLVSLP